MPEPPLKPLKSRKPSKRTDLDEWLAVHRPAVIGVPERDSICAAIGPISQSYLKKLLRDSGYALAPLVEGVRQDNLEALEQSLLAMPTDREGHKCVIEAKDHAKFALKKHPEKEEMILWMITWLENPAIFEQWVKLRRVKLGREKSSADTETSGT
jgi:hypothetical protein